MNEEWKQIVGHLDYEVSSLGRVRSNKRWPSIIMRTRKAADGYPRVTLRTDGRSHYIKVHTLVLIAFVGPKPKGMQALHRDANRTNAQLSNLRWGTQAENEADKIPLGLDNAGERHGMAKLTNKEAEEILIAYQPEVKGRKNRIGLPTQYELAAMYGVARATVARVVRGETKHI